MYGKIFESIYDGTLARNWQALVTFQQLIVLADVNGVVDMTVDALSRRTGIPQDILQCGIDALEKSDPESRSPDENGRRILRIADHRTWGWQLVNYSKYSNLRSRSDRNVYMKEYMRARRAKQKAAAVDEPVKANEVNGKQSLALLDHVDVDKKNRGPHKEKSLTVNGEAGEHGQPDASPAAPPAKRGSRFALQALPEDWRGYCREKRPDLDPDAVFEDFRDWWVAKAGKDALKADWPATWRGWVRRQKNNTKALPSGPNPYLRGVRM